MADLRPIPGLVLHIERYRWQIANGLAVAGRAYPHGGIAGPSCWPPPDSGEVLKDPTAWLRSANGFFAGCFWSDRMAIIAVDRIRSIPLFHAWCDGELVVSDDAEWLRRQSGCHLLDPVAQAEFLKVGYVTGEETLLAGIRQLRAGSLLEIRCTPEEKKPSVRSLRYFRYGHCRTARRTRSDSLDQLETAIRRSTERLLNYADGRQIVVPLSGGYDSRLVLAMLRSFGYDNLLALTYGREGGAEVTTSRRVAAALGVRWHCVPYSKDNWKQSFQSTDLPRYLTWSSSWTSVGHVQDFPAVKQVVDQGIASRDAVFAPGHTGDFVSGKQTAFLMRTLPFERLRWSEIVKIRHYSAISDRIASSRGRPDWVERIERLAEFPDPADVEGHLDLSETWNWQERQAKYIVNSVRAYEFFGLDWWLPQWDVEFVEFWQEASWALRCDPNFYNEFADAMVRRSDPSWRVEPVRASREPSTLRRFASRIEPLVGFRNLLKGEQDLAFAIPAATSEKLWLAWNGASARGTVAWRALGELTRLLKNE